MPNRLRPYPRDDARRGRHPRGQSIVEFALVLPLLLVLFLGIADFGRVFAAGITLEAAARNGAEAAAQEYVQLMRNRSDPLTSSDYDRLHKVAIEAICGEAALLPEHVVAGTGNCADISEGTATLAMPAAAICVHDGLDTFCDGSEAAGAPAECGAIHATPPNPPWNPANTGYDPPGAQGPLPYVEARVCYRFTTLFNLSNIQFPLGLGLSLGDIWMERSREFVAACYEQTSGPCN